MNVKNFPWALALTIAALVPGSARVCAAQVQPQLLIPTEKADAQRILLAECEHRVTPLTRLFVPEGALPEEWTWVSQKQTELLVPAQQADAKKRGGFSACLMQGTQ